MHGPFIPKNFQEMNLNEDRVYRLLAYVTEGSSPRTQRSRGTMTGRGTPVAAPELAEPLAGLLPGLAQGSHQPHWLQGYPQLSQWKTLPINSPSIQLQSLRELLPTGAWDSLWEVGKNILGFARLTMGCLREGPKTQEGKDQTGLGRNKCGKKQKKGDKRSWTYVNRLLVSMLVLKCSKGWGLCQPGLHPWEGWFWCT